MAAGAPVHTKGQEHGRDYVRRLSRQARAALKSRVERTVFKLGCIGFCGGLLSLLMLVSFGDAALKSLGITISFLTDESGALITSIFVLAGGLGAAYLAGRQAWINERAQIRRELDYYIHHFRGVLFDQGLLAIVLSDEPYTAIPRLGRVAGIPGTESIGRRGGSGTTRLSQRLETLFEYYGLICRHYRIEAYPPNLAGAVLPNKLRGALYHAFVFTLAEGVLGESAPVSNTLA